MVNPVEASLRDAVSVVRKRRSPYMLAGGIAAIAYGSPYPTGDVDIAFLVPGRDVERVARGLEGLGYGREHPPGLLSMVKGIRTVDLLPGASLGTDPAFDRLAHNRRRRLELYGMRVWAATPEDLVVCALLRFRRTGSAKSLRHAEGVVRGGVVGLDRKYIEGWARKHGTMEAWRRMPGAPG